MRQNKILINPDFTVVNYRNAALQVIFQSHSETYMYLPIDKKIRKILQRHIYVTSCPFPRTNYQ